MDLSPFPAGFLGVDLYHSGAWQDITADVDQAGVSVTHGARSEGSTADVSSLSFAVTNPNGKYSPRNPASPLSGLIGRNTLARARTALGAAWLDLEEPGARATTPDTTLLSITGDIDIRWWGYRDAWTTAADLISKYSTTSNQRSWILRAEANGTLTLFWSTNGTTVVPEARSTVPLPAWAGEIALRVTLDVDNGAGGHTVRFEYSDSLTGTWVQLGDDFIGTGTTSIFDSTAAVTLGKEPTSSAGTPPQRVYGFEIRQGIAGTVRSSRTMSALAAGTTSFTDDQGRTWTITSGSVTNTHVLAVGEVAEWPVDWNTKGAPSVMTEVQASGVTRRLGQGAQAVESVLYRAISSSADTSVRAYWPMEDGGDASSFGAAIGSKPMTRGFFMNPAGYDAFPGSAPIPIMNAGQARGPVGPYTSTGEIQVRWVQWTPAAGVASEVPIVRLTFRGGTIGWIDLKLDAAGNTGVFGYDLDGVELTGSTFSVSTNIEGTAKRFSLELNQNGANVFWRRSTLEPGQSSGSTFGQNFTAAHTLGRVAEVILNPTRHDLNDFAIGHVTAGDTITSLFDGVQSDILTGFTGEDAAVRMVRLAAENGTTLTARSRTAAAMGEQQEETLLDLMAEAAEADGGILLDDSRALGLRYRSLHSLGSQPAVVIPYQDNLVIPFKPTDDDAQTRNRVTVSRPTGTRITHEQADGPLGINTVGLYDTSLTLNLETDELVDRTAAWHLHIGTWDEGRYPTLGVDLAHPYLLANPELTRDLLALTVGDRLVIADPPPWLPPRDVDVIVQGITADITPHHLRLQWACVPARPHRIGYWNAGHRYSGEGTTLTTGAALLLNGVSPGRASTPDAAALDITGDLDVRVHLAMDDWTPATNQALCSKWRGSGNQRSFLFQITTTGAPKIFWSTDGSATMSATATATPTIANGAPLWVRVTLDVDNGAAGRDVRFYTSSDRQTWAQLGATVTIAGVTSIFNSTAELSCGANDLGTTDRLAGRVFSAEVRSGIAGTIVANPDFGVQLAGATSFVDSTGKTWTVTAPGVLDGSVILVTPPDGVAWTHADGDYDITVGGEVMTVTNVVGNTMTVTRSVNGVVKTHDAGTAVGLADPSFYAR